MKLKALVLTNMYPENDNYSGIFVKKNIKGLEEKFIVKVLKVKKSKYKLGRLVYYINFFFQSLFFMLFRRKEFSLIYIHFPTRTAIPLLFLRKNYIKLVLNFHGTDIISNSILNKILLIFLKKKFSTANLIVVPSEFLKSLIFEKFGTNINVLVSPSSGVPDSFYDFNYKKTYNGFLSTISCISNINEDKGVFDVCEAVIRLYNRGSKQRFIFYGNGSKSDIEKIKYYSNLCPLITYNGPIDHYEIPLVLESSDLFLFPSKKESLGLVGIEALATGTPIIGTNHPAITTYLKDRYNGLVFEMGNIDSLINVIDTLNNDKQLYMNLKFNSKISVESYKESIVHSKLNHEIFKIIS